MNWTTPTIDRLAAEGVKLENYFTYYTCVPARGALLTGRYPVRYGLWESYSAVELPLSEVTLGQEMQSAGYRTYMVGKWHLGFSTSDHTPPNRGFDSSYTYWNGFIGYWTKQYDDYNDLHDGLNSVTNKTELSSDYHSGYLMQSKAEDMIASHATNYSDTPMFLYYAMQLIHSVWSAPQVYLDRCGIPSTITDDSVRNETYNYCALNVMLDEAVANLTCALEQYNMSDNTILILVSDNGGVADIDGSSLPFKGNKGSFYRGGLSGTGFVHSKLLPLAARGQSYYGQMHVTDWLPTLMNIATNNEWKGSLNNSIIDGVNQWEAISTPNTLSPRYEILHYHDGSNISCIQINMTKLNLNNEMNSSSNPRYIFKNDLYPNNSYQMCENPSLINSESFFTFPTPDSIKSTMMELNDLVKSYLGNRTETILSTTITSTSTKHLNKSIIIVMIWLLVTLVIIISIRLANLMSKSEFDYIKSSLSTTEVERDCHDGEKNFFETSRLLR